MVWICCIINKERRTHIVVVLPVELGRRKPRQVWAEFRSVRQVTMVCLTCVQEPMVHPSKVGVPQVQPVNVSQQVLIYGSLMVVVPMDMLAPVEQDTSAVVAVDPYTLTAVQVVEGVPLWLTLVLLPSRI